MVVGAIALVLVGAASGAWAATNVVPGWLNAHSASSTTDGCRDELFLGVRGSGEEDLIGPTNQSTYDGFKAAAGALNVAADGVVYPSISVTDAASQSAQLVAAGDATSARHPYDDSFSQGVSALQTELYRWTARCPDTHFVLSGFSQGADVVAGTLAVLAGADGHPLTDADRRVAARIDGAALFGDPRYSPGSGDDAKAQGTHGGALAQLTLLSAHGGPRPAVSGWAGKVRSYCRGGDPVCDLDPGTVPACVQLLEYRTARPALIPSCKTQLNDQISVHLTYPDTGWTTLAGRWLAGLAQTRPPATSTQPTTVATSGPSAPCEKFVSDLTMRDGVAVAPGQDVTKSWRLRNCGSAPWTAITAVLVSGSSAPATFAVPEVAAGAAGTVSLQFTTPAPPGRYRWTYRLAGAAGSASDTFWVDFTVTPNPETPPVPSTPAPPPGTTAPPSARDCSAFIADVTMRDGTAVDPGQQLTKTWRLRNCGNTNWSALHARRTAGGFGPTTFAVPALAPGAVADVSLAFVAPSVAGHYQATYRLVNSGGGYAANSFWVDIVVRGPAAPPPATYHYAVYHTCANGHCGLNGRAGPGYSGYAVTRVLLDGAAVDIVCQTRGESVSGIDGSSSNVWDKTAQGDFFADFYINTPGMTGSFSPPIPQC